MESIVEKLRSACEEGNFETALELIESGQCSPTRKLGRGYSCLHYAAAHGELDVVSTLIEIYQCNPTMSCNFTRQGYTSLHFACYYGHIDVVKYLVREQKCNPYRLNKEGFTPLQCALINADPQYVPLHSQTIQDARHFEIVKFLVIECPCDLRRHGKLKALSCILHMACRYGTLEDIKCFIEKGFKVQACIANLKNCHPKKYDILRYKRNPITYNTLVHVACMNGRLEVVKYLIENEQCDPQECNSNCDNAAHIACRNGNIEVLKYLLEEQSLDPAICDDVGNTLLHLACMNEHLESATVDYLIEKGCKPNIENKSGELPLYLACQNQPLDIIKLVSAFTEPPEAKVKTTPVHIACAKGSLETVQHLVKERHWNPQCEDSHGLTPLHHACSYQDSYRYGWHSQMRGEVNLELVLFLVQECGCNPINPIALACKECDLELVKALTSSDVNCRNSYGNSPLHLACQYKAKKILRYLIEEAKCDPTIQNSMGELPLHIACEQTSLDIVKLVSDCNVDSGRKDGDTPLHIACKHGALDIARYLIQIKGCSPPQHREIYHTLCIHAACESEDMTLIQSIATPENVNNYHTYSGYSLDDSESFVDGTPLHIACKNGKLELVQFLVREMNASVNVANDDEKLPLHFACIHDSLEMVQLVSGCENVNCKDSQGNTPLHIACQNETLKIVQFLIREKLCDPTIQNKKGQLSLHIACQKQSLEMVLLVSDCDPNCTMNQWLPLDGVAPLHIACRYGNFDIAKYLIMEKKCDPTIKNSNGELPIHYACMHSLEMVRLVIDVCRQNLVSTTTNKGATPLHFACLYGKLEVVKFLTEEMAANPSVHDKKGLTPLHYACGICSYSNPDPIDSERIAAIAKYLVTRHECNPLENKNTMRQNSEDYNYSPLEMAVVEGHLELVKALTSGNLNVDYLNSSGESMLHEACAHQQLDIVKFLVTGRYCNQEVQNHTGQTALHIACKSGCLDTVRLVSSNCDVNMQTIDGDTPLHIACQHCHISIAKFLTEVRRSNSSIPNSQGEMALHIACKQKSLALVTSVSNCDVNARSRPKTGNTPLHITLKQRLTRSDFNGKESEQIVKYLVNDKRCDLSLPDEHGWLPLHIACKYDSLAIVILCSNCDVNARSPNEDTPLHIALKRRQGNHVTMEEYQIVEYLINEKCCDVSLPDKDGQLPLHIACAQDSLVVVALVSMCDVNSQTKDGNTPLHIALLARIRRHFDGVSIQFDENEQIVKYLVNEKQCDLSLLDKYGRLPLHVACQCDSLALVKLVSNCNVNATTTNGDTPLHTVIQQIKEHCLEEQKLMQIAEYLANEKHCDLSVPNKCGNLPLHIACQHNSLALVKLVSNCGMNIANENGNTPLHIALKQIPKEGYEIVQYLVSEKHCDLTLPDENGFIPLHIACQQGLLPLVELVSCCDVNARTNDGDTPLHIVLKAKNVRKSIVEYLVNKKCCDVTIPDNIGVNPIYRAVCWKGDLSVVKLLETVNSRSKNTPLHVACLNRQSPVIKILVGVDGSIVNVRNKDGNTPLHLVCSTSPSQYVIGSSDHRLYHLVECLIGDNEECDVSIANNNNESALHIACASPMMPLKVIELLVSRSTSSLCNLKDHLGDTPLHIACRRTSPTFADHLLKSQLCNADIQNDEEELPLHIACQKPKSFNSVIKMLSCQCRLKCTNKTGDTPLHILCRIGNLEAIQELVSIANSGTDIQNLDGEVPLHLAIACSFSQKIVELVGAHCHHSPNMQTKSGDTPLHIACKHGNVDAVKYLTESMHCASSIQNKSGLLPLHYASYHRSEAMARLVRNCNPNLQCSSEHEFKYRATRKSQYPCTCRIEAGDTPLHVACRRGHLKMISFLVNEMKCNVNIPNSVNEETPLHIVCRSYSTSLKIMKLMKRCNPNAQTKCGDTPLHMAVRHYVSTSTVKHLVQQMKCNVNIPNKSGEQPLHILLHQPYGYNDDVILLITNSLNVNSTDEHGNTPLHIACLKFSKKAIKYLSEIKGCDLNITNEDGDIPLHVACRMRNSQLEFQEHFDIVKLVSAGNMNVDARNLAGNTPLHEACRHGIIYRSWNEHDSLERVKHLILEKKCNPSIRNEQHELPLHLACRKCSLESVKLVSGVDDVNSQTTSGNTPLHEACQANNVETVKHLILEKKCNPSIHNEEHELPLHLACRRGFLNIVKLVSGVDDVDSQTTSGNTPLLEACMSKYTFYPLKELLEFLIEKGCNPKHRNNAGKTPLHCLCEISSDTEAIEYLLSISKSELSVADNEGQTPIMLTTNLSITKLLLKHGADATPLYEMHRAFFKNKTPPPAPLNVLVVGNASMGKTTLIESLKNEFCEPVLVEPEVHTAGVIPSDFESKMYGSVTFYDFAGQHEYYASHEAVVHNIIKHSPPVILLLINITETENEIQEKILYWTVLMEGRCTTLREKPHLIVVGSHLDQVTNAEENLSLLTASLQSRLEKSPLRFITHVAMDCRQSQSLGIEKLRHILQKSSEKLRDNAVMNFNCHCFCVFLQDKLNHFTALPVECVANAIISYARQTPDTSITEHFLSTNTQDVARICEELSNMGHLLFLKNHSRLEMSWVILKKERLLSTVNGTVFAPHSFKQHTDLSSSTGVVPFQKIATYFPRYDPNMIVGFLSHLEFCQEIHDQEVLDLLAPYDRATGPHSSTQRYFFFPRLVSIETPRGVWKSDQNYGYQWGWMLYCTNSEEFFTPHFLQVLILRLAFSFALTVPPKRPYWDEIPALKRACSVWKKGICWTSTAGIEATVEVIEQNQAVVAMVRSYKKVVSEAECIQLRSSIMRKVLQAKQTFCPNVSTAESFIHPKYLCYPLPCIREMSLLSLPIVAQAIVQIDPCAVTESGELLSIDELICFEPYSCLGESMLQILFNQENARNIVTDDFLHNMAGAIVENTDDHTKREFKRKVFIKVFKISPVAIKEATHDSDLETERLFRIFQVWCSHSDGTYQCLRQKLDDFSLFHGRNPLEIVPATSQQATQFISETSKSTHCTEQVYTLPSSREYDRMRQNFDTIITQLAAAKCSISLANKLRSEGLVSPEVYEEGVNVGPIVESKRIGCMINNVLARVKLNPEHYSTFIEILIEIGGQEDLVQLLQGPENMDV